MGTRRIHLAPDVGRIVGRHGNRIDRLEHRRTDSTPEPDPSSVVFTLGGALAGLSVSSPYQHPTGGLLVAARCKLWNPDPSIDTEVAFARNGTVIAPVHSWTGSFDSAGTPIDGETTFGRCVIAAGQREAVAFFVRQRFAPNLDELVVAVIATGPEAVGLTVRTDWGS